MAAKNIIMITGNDNTDSPTGLRALGFSFQIPEGKIFKVPNTLSTIRREMEIKSIIASNKPDGIFVSDDLTAILTMKIAHQLELKIPDNLKIIGYDGTSFIENFFPQLTTIRQPIDEIASLIVDVLLKKIKGEKGEQRLHSTNITSAWRKYLDIKSPTITKIAGDFTNDFY